MSAGIVDPEVESVALPAASCGRPRTQFEFSLVLRFRQWPCRFRIEEN
jgi:hypothetical protein